MESENAHAEPILVDCPWCFGMHQKGLKCPLEPHLKAACPDHGEQSVRSPRLDSGDFYAFYCVPHDHHFYIKKFTK